MDLAMSRSNRPEAWLARPARRGAPRRCARRPRRIRSRCPTRPGRRAPSIAASRASRRACSRSPTTHPRRDEFRLGVLFDLDPGWHLYWRDPGESGLATSLSWSVPGASVEPVAWPAPAAFRESEGLFTTYGYQGRVLLATRAVFGAGAPRERIARVRADLLVCEVECIPASLALERRLDTAREQRRRARALRGRRAARSARARRARHRARGGLRARTPRAGRVRLGLARRARLPGASDAARGSRPARPPSSPTAGAARSSRRPASSPTARAAFAWRCAGARASSAAPRLTGVLALVDGDGAPPVRGGGPRASGAAAATATRGRARSRAGARCWPCSAGCCST